MFLDLLIQLRPRESFVSMMAWLESPSFSKRGECCLRTLVDHKQKRYDNVVDVVICLHDRPILVPKVRRLHDLHTFGSVMSHKLTIQQTIEGELLQHDGVMTVMMKLPMQGFA